MSSETNVEDILEFLFVLGAMEFIDTFYEPAGPQILKLHCYLCVRPNPFSRISVNTLGGVSPLSTDRDLRQPC